MEIDVKNQLKPWKIGFDLGEKDCSGVGYVVPEHTKEGEEGCFMGSGRHIVRENQMELFPGGGAEFVCGCGGIFYIGRTLHSEEELGKNWQVE